jgi:23S rRNA (adenine2503-C2)-methyltransferase
MYGVFSKMTSAPKIQLKNMSLEEMEAFFLEIGEKPFRARQLFKWIWQKRVQSFEEMTDLSKDLHSKLKGMCSIQLSHIETPPDLFTNEAGKHLIRFNDGRSVETVIIPDENRLTVCVSSQVGCAMNCDFCQTGKMGLIRQLSAGEIVDQLFHIQSILTERVTNIVFMGMGEPFHNYDEVIKAAYIMNHDLAFKIGARKITISTSGLIPEIIRFTDDGHRFKLAVSLNGTTDEQRVKLMPLNKKWPMQQLIDVIKRYNEISHNAMMFEYVLLANVNDDLEDAKRLIHIAEKVFCKVNLIPYNETSGPFQRPSNNRIQAFYKAVNIGKFPVIIRWSKGADNNAACGQLSTSVDN